MLVEDGGGGDVDPLGDLGVLVPEQLHAQEPAGGAVAGEAHRDAMAAGVVGLVVIGLRADRDRVEPGRDGFVVAQPGAGGGLVEDLHHLGAQAARELPVPAQRVLPGDPALLVRGGAQRQVGLSEQPVMSDHAVPGGEHIRQAGPHPSVDRDRALDAERGPGSGRQAGVGTDADDDQDQVGRAGHGRAVGCGCPDSQPAGLARRGAGNLLARWCRSGPQPRARPVRREPAPPAPGRRWAAPRRAAPSGSPLVRGR